VGGANFCYYMCSHLLLYVYCISKHIQCKKSSKCERFFKEDIYRGKENVENELLTLPP
jgi:hypothetical protein